jgi:predicted  nucleic acid-binding Zn-ribbon protein
MDEEPNFEQAYSQLQQMEVALRPFASISKVLHAAMAAKRALPRLEQEVQAAQSRAVQARENLASVEESLTTGRHRVGEEIKGLEAGRLAKVRELSDLDRQITARQRAADEARVVQEAEWAGRLNALNLEGRQLQEEIAAKQEKLRSLRDEARKVAS